MGREYTDNPTGVSVRLNAGKQTESSLNMRAVENDAEHEQATMSELEKHFQTAPRHQLGQFVPKDHPLAQSAQSESE